MRMRCTTQFVQAKPPPPLRPNASLRTGHFETSSYSHRSKLKRNAVIQALATWLMKNHVFFLHVDSGLSLATHPPFSQVGMSPSAFQSGIQRVLWLGGNQVRLKSKAPRMTWALQMGSSKYGRTISGNASSFTRTFLHA